MTNYFSFVLKTISKLLLSSLIQTPSALVISLFLLLSCSAHAQRANAATTNRHLTVEEKPLSEQDASFGKYHHIEPKAGGIRSMYYVTDLTAIRFYRGSPKSGKIIAYFSSLGDLLPEQHKAAITYRKYLGKNEKGYYLVQDFYPSNNQKKSDPFQVKLKQDLIKHNPLSIEGNVINWHENGHKYSEGEYNNGQKNGLDEDRQTA